MVAYILAFYLVGYVIAYYILFFDDEKSNTFVDREERFINSLWSWLVVLAFVFIVIVECIDLTMVYLKYKFKTSKLINKFLNSKSKYF